MCFFTTTQFEIVKRAYSHRCLGLLLLTCCKMSFPSGVNKNTLNARWSMLSSMFVSRWAARWRKNQSGWHWRCE